MQRLYTRLAVSWRVEAAQGHGYGHSCLGAICLLSSCPCLVHYSAPLCVRRRRELRDIEATAVAFQVATEEATAWEFDGVRSLILWISELALF